MNKIKLLGFVLIIILGGFIFVFGEADDSPGAQGIALLMVIGGGVGVMKSRETLAG